MAETAEVVVVGGGVVGSSIACHLVEAGVRDVLVLEDGERAVAGSTGRAMGGARAQFANPAHIRMSLHSLEAFASFHDRTGVPSGFRPDGYLLLATRPGQMERLREVRELQLAAGLRDVELLDADAVARRFPLLRPDTVLGGAFRQGDGFIDPRALQRGFARRAMEGGARFRLGAPARGFRREGDRVAGVDTAGGFVATRVVVNAAGPWAARVAALAGVDLPVRPLRRQIVGTRPVPGLPPDLPMVIDLSDGFHFRPDHGAAAPHGLRIAAPDPEEVWDFATDFDPAFAEALLPRAERAAPLLRGLVVDPARCSAGLYAVSPDHHAILGESAQVRGFFLANGFSGHGVMHSPATGVIVSEQILYGQSRTFPEAAAFAPDRFLAGRPLHEPAVF